MEQLKLLIGKTITNILYSEGTYYSLKSEKTDITNSKTVDEIVIIIEDYSLTVSNNITTNEYIKYLNLFIGKIIKEINETKEELKIITQDNNWLAIDLRDEAFIGPEGMSLNGPNNLVVVWN